MNPLLKIACEFAAASLQGQRAQAESRGANYVLAWKDAQQLIDSMPEPFRAAMAIEMKQHEMKDVK